MSNAQMWVAMIMPTIAVLIGILLNHNRIGSVEASLGARISHVETRLTSIEGDLRKFYQFVGEHSSSLESHGARLDKLEQKRS